MPATAARRKPRKAAKSRPSSALLPLYAELRQIAVLGSVGAVIGWDQETMMPHGGGSLRAEQREMMSALAHERRTSKRLGSLIAAAESEASRGANARTLANLREIRRDYDKARQVPASLVAEIARCSAIGMEAWKEARKNSDFKGFLPHLERLTTLARDYAKCLGAPRGGELYDALLDQYEPGATARQIEGIFGPLRARLVPLIDRVKSAKAPSEAPARAEAPIDGQQKLISAICRAIGFDFGAGRMDDSAHPFCEGIGPGDTRMTNRYRPDGWTDSISTAMHESGHGMYEQGLPKEKLFGQPLAEAVSLGIHESQSRMWENLVGRSRPFWRWAHARARSELNGAIGRASADDLYKAVNIIRPKFIRVESDELTYNLHIMLRFDLERAMLAGDLKLRDLPGVWNERIKKDLGLKVPDDRRGCLQDVHWAAGLLGYFPTYTLGNLYASQFWEAMGRDLPGRDARISRGDFGPILQWLRENIHKHGRRYSAAELCKRVTGQPLTHDPLLRHLEAKVRNVYGV